MDANCNQLLRSFVSNLLNLLGLSVKTELASLGLRDGLMLNVRNWHYRVYHRFALWVRTIWRILYIFATRQLSWKWIRLDGSFSCWSHIKGIFINLFTPLCINELSKATDVCKSPSENKQIKKLLPTIKWLPYPP